MMQGSAIAVLTMRMAMKMSGCIRRDRLRFEMLVDEENPVCLVAATDHDRGLITSRTSTSSAAHARYGNLI